jgi:Leucine-rich repeat (LRR) protein
MPAPPRSQGGSYAPPMLSPRADDPYNPFLLDGAGKPILDDQGSPCRKVVWKPTGNAQRTKYEKLQKSVVGSSPSAKWARQILASPPRIYEGGAGVKHRQPLRRGIGGAAIPDLPGRGNSTGKPCQSGHKQGERQRRRPSTHPPASAKSQRVADGFAMLEGCGVDLPETALNMDICGGSYDEVSQADLQYFLRLRMVNAADNNLPFESFAAVRNLIELRMQCNGLREIRICSQSSYLALQRLDVSYNALSEESITCLAHLPNLRRLDLTCNGLKSIPTSLVSFPALQTLILERNQLEGVEVFRILGALPTLRHLSLAFNYLTNFILETLPGTTIVPFAQLDFLDLAFNYIASEEGIADAAFAPRLERVIVYGNPLCGPSGEDFDGVSVKKVTADAVRARDGWATGPLDVITEMPRKARERSVSNRVRRRPYSDVSMSLVGELQMPLVREFKVKGAKTLFESMRSTEPAAPLKPQELVDATIKALREKRQQEDLTFMTGIDAEQEIGGNEEEEKDRKLGGTKINCQQHEIPVLEPPMQLLESRGPPQGGSDPGKLRMAITSLRSALKRVDVQLSGEQNAAASGAEISRTTQSQLARQLPRRPYQLRRLRHEATETIGAGGAAPIAGSSLDGLEQLLEGMKGANDRLSLEQCGLRTHQQGGSNAGMESLLRMINHVVDSCS